MKPDINQSIHTHQKRKRIHIDERLIQKPPYLCRHVSQYIHYPWGYDTISREEVQPSDHVLHLGS